MSAHRPRPHAEEARLHGLRHVRSRDAKAISHHYDVGNDFYRLVLGPSLTYSCAYWADDDFDLADAQTAKYELISRKLDLRPGMRLLDVGCGWGGMVLHAAQHHGVDAVGVTLSHEQARLARERVHEAGLDDRIEIRVQDYRDVSDGPFDAISSIGMFEHVGVSKAEEYFHDLHGLLAPGARLLNHAISRPTPAGRAAIAPRSFMARYVFPDAELLEVGTVVSAMQRQELEVRDVESLREHYARTLRVWVGNLEHEWERAQQLVGPARAAGLVAVHGGLCPGLRGGTNRHPPGARGPTRPRPADRGIPATARVAFDRGIPPPAGPAWFARASPPGGSPTDRVHRLDAASPRRSTSRESNHRGHRSEHDPDRSKVDEHARD